MSEELLYNSGRPRRTRSSFANSASTPIGSNPYKKPTYLVGRSTNNTPDDSPDEAETPQQTRGRRKPGRPFGSVTKNKSAPASTSATPPSRGSRRGSTRSGRGRGATRNVETTTTTSGGSANRKRGSTSTPNNWAGKSRPECVASRNDRRSTGSRSKKKRRGYNTHDYHYGSDFESDQVESEPEEQIPSESESVEDVAEDEDDMPPPLDEPLLLEDDMDVSVSTRLIGLPSIPVPIWMDPDAHVEELEIPRSSDDLLLSRKLLIDAVAIYEPLRRFSNLVRLTPFRFEDFCAALASEEQSPLLAEVHTQLLKSLIREDEVNGTTFGPHECKDSVQTVFFFMDSMSWAECLRAYIDSDSAWSDIYKVYTSVEYPFCGPDIRIRILTWLIDAFIVSNNVRDLLTSEGKILHEDHCRSCNRLGELICCETCPAVYHFGCISLAAGEEDPPDEWTCPICELHQLPGVNDCLSEIEKAGLLLRHEKLGFDRHGRKYWFLVRRILVESDDKSEVWYYSTRLQVEELLHRLDAETYEKILVENILHHKEEIFRQMAITEAVTNKMNSNHRKTYLEAENAFLTRIYEERELIKEQKAIEKRRIEEEIQFAKRKEFMEKQRLEEEERIKREEEKRRIREERLAKRNQIKLKQRVGKLAEGDEALEQFLLNEESKDSFMDHDDVQVKEESAENSDESKPDDSSDSKSAILENGDTREDEYNIYESDTQRIVPDNPILDGVKGKSIKVEVKGEEDNEEEEDCSREVKIEPKDIEPIIVKTSILPKIAAKSKSLNLEVDSEERMTRLKSTGLYKLGNEGSFRSYVNNFTTDPLALSKNQHVEERDKRRVVSHKFSLTPASECKWGGPQHGFRTSILSTIRQTLLQMEIAVPTTLMHCNWILLRKTWMSTVSSCTNANDFSKAIIAFAACLRPCVFNPVWAEGVGHVKLFRTSAMDKEMKKKNEKRDKKDRDDEEDRLKLLKQFIKYSLPPKHQIWKQKGEEYRVHGNWGWIWLSTLRSAKPKDARKCGLLNGPHKHVIQVKGNSGKVKTMLIDPDVYDKLMAKRTVSLEKQKSEPPPEPVKNEPPPCPVTIVPKIEPKQEDLVAEDVKAVLESLINDVVECKDKPTLTSLIQQIQDVKVKEEPMEVNQETPPIPATPASSEQKPPEVKTEKSESCTSPSRKFRTDLINVSLGIVSANRILYPKIAHQVNSLDTLLARRIKLQGMEEKELLETYGAETLESMKDPPPVLDTKPIVVTVDGTFPLAGGYARQCYSYECQIASNEKKPNFEAQCYSPMCRLKFVIVEARRRKFERERKTEFDKRMKERKEIEEKRCYNQSSSSEKVYLKKLPEEMKNQDLVKYPLGSKFCCNSTKRPNILAIPKHDLMKLARTAGRKFVPTGFTVNPRPNTWLWPYPCGRPFFRTTWQYRTIHSASLATTAFQLRVLYACVRWDDIVMKPLNPEGINQTTTDMEVVTSEILNHRIIGRFLETFQYLRRKHIVPIDAPKPIRGKREISEVTPSRSGLRKRKRAESPENTGPVVNEEWVYEEKVDIWEIRLYGEKIERKNEKKPEPPSGSTRTKTGVTLKQPEKWDPSPKEIKEKVEKEIKLEKEKPIETPDILVTEIKSQRIVHLSKRDNHAKIINSPKVPVPTASQQLLQQQNAAAAAAAATAAAAAAAAAVTQALLNSSGNSQETTAVAIKHTNATNGRKFFVTKPTITVGAKTNPPGIPEKIIPIKTGILKKPFVPSPAPVGVGSPTLSATALINSTSTTSIIRQPTQIIPGIPTQNQKFQVFRSPDGKLQVKGLMPGQQAFQTGDGRVHVISPGSSPDEKQKIITQKSTILGGGTHVSSLGILRASSSTTTPITSPTVAASQPRVNISNHVIRTVMGNTQNTGIVTNSSLVRPPETTYAPSKKKIQPIVKPPLPPQIITVNRTAADLKDTPLHLQTGRGIIQVNASNITKSSTGQDQIILGPGLPIIQLLPCVNTQGSTIQQTPAQVVPTTSTVQLAASSLPAPAIVATTSTPLQQSQQLTQGTAPMLPSGSKIVYNDGNRSFILNTAGYTQAQVQTLLQQLHHKKIVIKPNESTSGVVTAQVTQPQTIQPQFIIQQQGLGQVQLQQQQQPLFVQQSHQVIVQQPQTTTLTNSHQSPTVQQIATIGGQKVFFNRTGVNPLLRSITPAGGTPTQVFQKLVPGVTSIGGSGSGITITPPQPTQFRPMQLRQTITSSGIQQQRPRASLPISIVSPSKPRGALSNTGPIRINQSPPRGDTTSPQSSLLSLSPSACHPGIMTSQQLTGLLQKQQVPTTIPLSPPTVRLTPTTISTSVQRPTVTLQSPVIIHQAPKTISSITPPTGPQRLTIVRGNSPAAVTSTTGNQLKSKITVQVVNGADGQKLLIQGLPPNLAPEVMAQLEAQLSKQLSIGGLISGGSLVGGFQIPVSGGTTISSSIHTQSVGVVSNSESNSVNRGGIYNSGPSTPTITSPILVRRSPPKTILVKSKPMVSPGEVKVDPKSIDESIEAAIGTVMQCGSAVIRNNVISTGIGHTETSQIVNFVQSPIIEKRIGQVNTELGNKPPSPKKRKISETQQSMTKMLSSSIQEFPTDDVAVESEARFILSQDLVAQTKHTDHVKILNLMGQQKFYKIGGTQNGHPHR